MAFGHPPGWGAPRGPCHSPGAQPCFLPLGPLSTGENKEGEVESDYGRALAPLPQRPSPRAVGGPPRGWAPPAARRPGWCCVSSVGREVAAETHGSHLESPCGRVTQELTAHPGLGGGGRSRGSSLGPGPGRGHHPGLVWMMKPQVWASWGQSWAPTCTISAMPRGRPRVSESKGGVLPAQRSRKAPRALGHGPMGGRLLRGQPPLWGDGRPRAAQLRRQPPVEGCPHQPRGAEEWVLRSGRGLPRGFQW